jgi:hypothetical protein
VIIGRSIDRFGADRIAAVLFVLGPIGSLVWMFLGPGRLPVGALGPLAFLWPNGFPIAVLVVCLGALAMGGFYGMAHVCQTRLSQAHTPVEGRTISMAVHWSLVGLIAAPAPLIAGWIKDHFPPGWRTAFPWGGAFDYFQVIILAHAGVAILIALPVLLALRREKK